MSEATLCAHRWRIELPNGPTSRGYCQKCGAERSFRNSLENDIAWSDLSPLGQRRLRQEAS